MERCLLLPKFIIFETENKEILLKELEKYRFIYEAENCLIQVERDTEVFLKGICGKKHHLKMSRGIIYKGNTQVTEGPLRGWENHICKIDRHKKLARVKTMVDTNALFIPAGLEIMERII